MVSIGVSVIRKRSDWGEPMDPFPLVGKDLPELPSLDWVYAIIHGVMGALRDLGGI